VSACTTGTDIADSTSTTDPSPPTSSEQPTTTITTTTTPATTTTTSTTLAAPTTTVDMLRAEIETAYEVLYEGYWACLRAPESCDPNTFLAPGSGSARAMAQTRDELINRDLHVADSDPGYWVIESIEPGPEADEVTVRVCWYLSAVLLGPPADPNLPVGSGNPATIVNNTPGSQRQADIFGREADGSWRVRNSTTNVSVVKENLCPPES
jgi:hypothetical protein